MEFILLLMERDGAGWWVMKRGRCAARSHAAKDAATRGKGGEDELGTSFFLGMVRKVQRMQHLMRK